MAGDVRVNYEVKVGSISPQTTDLRAALANDFAAVAADYVTVADGQSSGIIPVVIFEDDQPEVDEVLLATITSVELLGQSSGNFLPKLGTYRVFTFLICIFTSDKKSIFNTKVRTPILHSLIN